MRWAERRCPPFPPSGRRRKRCGPSCAWSRQGGPDVPTPRLLAGIRSPEDLKRIPREKLPQVAAELRELIVQGVSRTGGHLASSLGVVELTIALHYVYSCPTDRIVWDVGHQAYAHKILTGRRE